MGNLRDIRKGLADRLETIEGLRAYSIIPDSLSVPCAVVGVPDPYEYDHTFSRGKDRMKIPIRLYVSRVNDRTGQEKVDAYLAKSGDGSIKEAIEGDITLAGAADTIRVERASGYGVYPIAGVDYLGVEFIVDVIS